MKFWKFLLLPIIAIALITCQSNPVGGGDLVLQSEVDSMSYSFGAQVGNNIEFAADQLNIDALLHGMRDALMKKGIKLSDEEILAGFNKCNQVIRKSFQENQQKLATENMRVGLEFLKENKSKEGVVELPSGLQYKVLQEGTGASPVATDKVLTHYRGTLIDGSEFDSSYKRGEPISFSLNGVIPGWTEGIQLMKEGAKYEFYIPSNLAYGERGSGQRIPPNSTLIFEVELVKVNP